MTHSNQSVGIRTEKSLIEYLHPLDHACMMETINVLCERYSFLSVSYVGESILGRGIPLVTLGEGEKSVLYVGAHRGDEWMSSLLLLRMINEYCETMKNGGKLLHYNLRYLFSSRTLYIIPMLNPDGVEYALHGVQGDHVMYERVMGMNGGNPDFSLWQANARGVDLTQNYATDFAEYKRLEIEQGILGGQPCGYGGDMPESEPEVAQLCNWIHYHGDIRLAMELRSGEKGVYVAEELPKGMEMGASLSRAAGYSLKPLSSRGMSQWCTGELGVPSFHVSYGTGERIKTVREYFYYYAKLRQMLFLAPSLI
ncbi:MAG: hypothetical protein IJY47_03380 [Clostridia bacterium]|nr:hypothetical protein [Clostridia bacterium]